MKRKIIQSKKFRKTLISFIKQNRLIEEDFKELEKDLIVNPESGDLVSGTGGIRKIRLKAADKGKSGGFRICYFDDSKSNSIFLLLIYPKNLKEDLNQADRKVLKDITNLIKREKSG
jgi:mRNA-degrading endonuclease RelE of RelBE toxin-antitoxin system